MPEGRPRGPIPRVAAGYSVEGRGFYVWEEDAREAALTGGALLRVAYGGRVRLAARGRRGARASAAAGSPPPTAIDDGGSTC